MTYLNEDTSEQKSETEEDDNDEIEKLCEFVVRCWNCDDCGQKIKLPMKRDCGECGQGIAEEALYQTLLGFDIVGLFLAMKSKNTGEIIRRRILMSNMELKVLIGSIGLVTWS